jgi:serine phosphatase RsbU (regulator of sigma subunit)
LGIKETLIKVEVETFDYSSGFTLMCYTDGLTDTYNSASNENVTVDALKEIIRANHDSTPELLNKSILFYAEEFKGETEFPDDIAILTMKVADLNF